MADSISNNVPVNKPEPSSPVKVSRREQRVLDLIDKHAAEDRVASKRAYDNLKFASGDNPRAREQRFCVKQFETFREDSLGQDIKKPYAGDDLIQFFEYIVSKGSLTSDKTEVYVEDVQKSVKLLIDYGHFHWKESDGFKITADDKKRFQRWFKQAKTDGRVQRSSTK